MNVNARRAIGMGGEASAVRERDRRVVRCRRCSATIELKTVHEPVDEFSLACPSCGRRGIYSRNDLRHVGS